MPKKKLDSTVSASLVLNRNWQAINAMSVRRALIKVAADKARIINPDTYETYDLLEWMALEVKEGEPYITTPSQKVKIPEVIVNQYPKLPIRRVHFSRANLWKRDNYRCQYCGKRPKPDEVTIDHILPKSKGGKTTFANTVLACLKCNVKKDNRTPEQAHMKLRRMKRIADGTLIPEYYGRPKAPIWNPIYSIKKQSIPGSWSKFIQDVVSDLYWNTALEP